VKFHEGSFHNDYSLIIWEEDSGLKVDPIKEYTVIFKTKKAEYFFSILPAFYY
jgi:hypothetical protein